MDIIRASNVDDDLRYLGPFFKWTREELEQMDLRNIKIMTIYKALQSSDDKDKLDMSRKKGGGISIIDEDSINISIQ